MLPLSVRNLLALCLLLLGVLSPARAQLNPADYGNITLHLKAETLGLANNAPVTAWNSLTAAGLNAPTFISSDARFGNKPVVRFDGASDVMTWASSNINARTIFAVVTLESSAVSLAGLIGRGDDKLNVRRNGTSNFYRSIGQGADANDFCFVGTPTGNLYVNNVVSGGYTPGTSHIVLSVAGSQQVFTNFWLGSASTALGRYWNGSVAEVIVYDGALTAQGINNVGYYLQTKYGITGSTYTAPPQTINSFTATAGGVTATTGVLSTPGAPVTLAWNTVNASSVSIDNGALSSSSSASGSVNVAPSVTTTYTLTANGLSGSSTRSVTVYIGPSTQPLALNEFLADNGSGILDEDGTKQDWIEIYNPNPFAVSANGWQLVGGTTTWTFPNVAIEGGAYFVVFASEKNRTNPASPLHTNFKLNVDGEYLALKKADGTIVTEFAPAFPTQRTDISGGLSGGIPVFYPIPTPGAANGATVSGFVADTNFSVTRGFYTTPQTVALTCATPGAEIRYTADNSTPTATTGAVYSGPLNISATTVLRARAFKSGLLPSNTDTQTYIFAADVLNQGASPAGWPASGVNGQALRYGFNATLKAQYTTQQLLDALAQIPSFSIVTDQPNLTDATTGMYVNALSKGDAWERAASVELLNPDNSSGFHIDCGLRIRGGYSRNDQYPKHAFRLFFRNQYGAGELTYPLFGTAGTDEFQTIDLRTEENYHWANDGGTQNTAVREVFSRDLFASLGQPGTRSRYYHLYLNGQYWGLYMTEERSQEDYGSTYLGGTPEDYDVIQTSNHPNFTYEVASGTVDAWQQTWNLARACAANPTNANYFALLGRDQNGVRIPAMPVYIDPDHLATYLLLHYYTGDGDGPLSNFLSMNQANNWRGMRNRLDSLGWRFFPHDCEHTLRASSWVDARATNNTTGGANRSVFTYSNSEWIHEDLATNAEYRLKIANVAQRYLFNNGALTSAKAQALFDARANQISAAIIADCARWGTSSTNHTLVQWQSRLAEIRTNFFPSRSATVLGHLQTRGFYPSATPPAFSQRGGRVSVHYALTLSAGAQAGTIYYTLDGSDPRAVGGAPMSGAPVYSGPIFIDAPVTVRTRFLSSGGVWSAIDDAIFTTFSPAIAGKLVVSKLYYHPSAPTSAEVSAGYTSEEDFEYVELQSISAETLDLHGVALSGAVVFSFATSPIQSLAAGSRVLVVGNAAAFAMRHGTGLPVAGVFDGNFANGSELLRVADLNNADIAKVEYDDASPWPTSADGDGPALVLVNLPPANPSLGTNWRASYVPGGAPGAADAWTIGIWRLQNFPAADLANPSKESTLWGDNADPDLDGWSNRHEFALGTLPLSGASHPVQATGVYTDPGTQQQYLRISCTVRDNLGGVTIAPIGSSDLATWSGGPALAGAPIPQSGGTSIYVWQDSIPLSAAPDGRRFLRLQITINP